MAFDGIVTKKVVEELKNIISYKIDKIYQPEKNTLVLGLYQKYSKARDSLQFENDKRTLETGMSDNYSNVALLACVSSNNYRIHLTTHTLKNPTVAPNFCMLLRKHILGYKIKDIYTKDLERIVFIELENLENPDKPIYKTLIVELMGKHSNFILTDGKGIIIDSLRHTSTEDNALRDIYPTARYFMPKPSSYNLLENSPNASLLNESNLTIKVTSYKNDVPKDFVLSTTKDESKDFVLSTTKDKSKDFVLSTTKDEPKDFILSTTKDEPKSNELTNKNDMSKDLSLTTHESSDVCKSSFQLNFALDDFYYSKETSELFTNYRNALLNLILAKLKKYEKRLLNIDSKLTECADRDKFKLYGELITANLYKITSSNLSSIKVENYYDNNNLIEIPLDKKYSPSYNAKRYFKKYSKLKNALEVVGNQKKETLEDIKYIESIVYELENAKTTEDVQEIYNEISESPLFERNLSYGNSKRNHKKPKKMTTNKFAKFNPLKYTIDGYTIYVGRNNKENDYLTNKFANKNDIWFHTKEIHGSHIILKTNPNEIVPDSVLYETAKLAVLHSKAKSSSNVPVDYCLVRFVKKIPGNKPGLVTYSNNKTIFI